MRALEVCGAIVLDYQQDDRSKDMNVPIVLKINRIILRYISIKLKEKVTSFDDQQTNYENDSMYYAKLSSHYLMIMNDLYCHLAVINEMFDEKQDVLQCLESTKGKEGLSGKVDHTNIIIISKQRIEETGKAYIRGK